MSFAWLDAGFANATCAEAESAYRFLSIKAWTAWSTVLTGLGQGALAQHFLSYASTIIADTRAAGSDWFVPLGMYASADAIHAGRAC